MQVNTAVSSSTVGCVGVSPEEGTADPG